jgi:hypothetical protein
MYQQMHTCISTPKSINLQQEKEKEQKLTLLMRKQKWQSATTLLRR